MSTVPQAETEIVTGIVQGVVAKATDKWQVEVNVGQQNPRRLWTKDADLVQQMMGMIGQTLSFMCGKSHWTNNSGQPVTSLWINGYGVPDAFAQQPMPTPMQAGQAAPPQPMPVQQMPMPVPQQPMPQPVAQNDREDRIHRQTASKVAAILLTHIEPDKRNLTSLISISERLVAYYEHGVQWGGGGQGNPSAPAVTDGDPGPQGIPLSDDEIPF